MKNSVLHFISAIHSTMAFNKVFHSILGIFYYGRYCIGRKWYVLSLERALHHRRKNQFETWGSSMPVSLSESAFLFLTRQSRFETNVCSRLITNQDTHTPPRSKLSPHQSPPHTHKRKKKHTVVIQAWDKTFRWIVLTYLTTVVTLMKLLFKFYSFWGYLTSSLRRTNSKKKFKSFKNPRRSRKKLKDSVGTNLII